jgi:hypothetical protein
MPKLWIAALAAIAAGLLVGGSTARGNRNRAGDRA